MLLLRAPQTFWAPTMVLLHAWNWYLHANNAHDFRQSLLAARKVSCVREGASR